MRRPEPHKLVAFVSARQSSRRFPGKVLFLLEGRPLLAHTLDRMRSIDDLDDVVIVTSTDPSDDAVAEFVKSAGAACWRGPLEDLLGRFHGAAAASDAQAIVRISGDSPLIDPAVVRTAIRLFQESAVDLVTNVFPRSFPKGQSVEILSRAALDKLNVEAVTLEDREHVTRYAYTHPERFRIRNFSFVKPRPELQLSVDTAADMDRAAALIAATCRQQGFATVGQLIELADALAAATCQA